MTDRSETRAWYRRPRPLLLIGALVVVAVLVAVAALVWANRGAEEVSTEDVINRFRQQEGAGDGSAGFLRPAAGVYTYDATGTERLSVLGTSQQWGPTMPSTVTHDDEGCWTIRLDYSTNHWQEQRFCPTDDRLLEDGGRTFQSFDFGITVSDTNVFTCDPRAEAIRIDAAPGDTWDQTCTGHSEGRGTNVTSSGTNTFVGVEELQIDGESVGALHYHLQRTLSGDQTGTEDEHRWYSVTDAMLLRATHDTRVASPSPIGDVIYTEQGELQLTSRTPRT